MRSILLALLVLGGCGSSDLEKATQSSAKQERPLVIMATASWCGPCRHFKKNILPSPEVQQALKDVEFVMLEHGRSKGSLQRLGVRAYPTFLVVNGDEKVVAVMQGFSGARSFLDFLRWATPNWFSEQQIEAGLGRRRDSLFRLYAARWHTLRGKLEPAGQLYRDALAGLKENEEWRRAGIEWEMVLVGSVGSSAETVAKRALQFIFKFPGSVHVSEAADIALLSGGLSTAEATSLGHKVIGQLKDDPVALNSITYAFLGAQLHELALVAARRQVEQSPGDANAFDTLAEANNYLGNTEEAVRAADRAIAMENSSDSRAAFTKNRKRYVAGLPSPHVVRAKRRVEATLRRYRISQR